MMIRRFIAVLMLAVGVLITGMIVPSPVHVEKAEAAEKFTCLNASYYSFISDVRSDETKRQYFSDLFSLSYCQINDILELEEELDAVRDSFRTAAINCESVNSYEKQYVEILLEEHFVRTVQRRDPGVLDGKNAEIIDASKDKILEALYDDMHNKFVTEQKLVSSGDLKDYFAAWSYEYDDRIGQYLRCDEGVWAELNKSINSFKDTIQEIKDTAERIKHIRIEKSGSFWDKLYSPIDEQIVTPIKNTLAAWKEARANAKQKKTTEQGADDSFAKAIDAFDLESALDTLASSQVERAIVSGSIDRMSDYRALYGEGGSLAAYEMQNTLQLLNAVIDVSNTKDLPAIKDFVEKIEAKQCN